MCGEVSGQRALAEENLCPTFRWVPDQFLKDDNFQLKANALGI
jgi:hypothetical protein